MSMVICVRCERLVDSADDPDCFCYSIEKRNDSTDHTFCKFCRDELEDQYVPQWMTEVRAR